VRTPAATTLIVLAAVCCAASACERYDSEGLVHCGQEVERRYPEPGAGDAFAGGWLVIDLSCPASEPGATLQTPGASSYQVTVQQAHEGRQLRILPGVPLLPETAYNAHVEVASEETSWIFTTSSLGNPLTYSLAGHVEELALDDGHLVSPPGLGQTLLEPLHAVRPAIQFLLAPGVATVPGRLGTLLPEGGVQDTQWATFDRAFAWQEPYYSVGPLDLRWVMEGWELSLEAATFSGASHPSLGGIGLANLQARWDTRAADVELGGSAGSLCATAVAQGGAPCIPCNDGEVSCLDLLLLDIPTTRWAGALGQVL